MPRLLTERCGGRVAAWRSGRVSRTPRPNSEALMFTSWLRRLARWSPRPPAARAPRVGIRPRVPLRVEALEGRWVPATVTTLSDGVPGSLRDALATTPAGGVVDFQPGLSGPITLTGR